MRAETAQAHPEYTGNKAAIPHIAVPHPSWSATHVSDRPALVCHRSLPAEPRRDASGNKKLATSYILRPTYPKPSTKESPMDGITAITLHGAEVGLESSVIAA